MASKQGGKGKQSSPSRKASHLRARTHAETRREKRIARHARRMGLTVEALRKSGAVLSSPDFPRVPQKRPLERVIFGGGGQDLVKSSGGIFPLHLILSNGVTLNSCLKASEAALTVSEINSRTPYEHFTINPVSGARTLVSSRGRF